jgi:hypothetical protein
MTDRTFSIWISAAALLCLAAGVLPAAAQTATPLVQITTHDTFATCTADAVAQQETELDGTLYPNTAIEPWVAIDPTNPKRLLVVHQQDRWTGPGARGNVGNLSTDGGATWNETIPPGVTDCTGGEFARASDPWVTFAPDGTAYAFSLVVNPGGRNPNGFEATGGGMIVSRSNDHGESWGAPITLITDGAHAFNDKNSITADPHDSRFVYAVWDRLVLGAGAAPQLGLDGVVAMQNRLFRHGAHPKQGPTLFARTTNGGASWETPRVIFDPGIDSQTINNTIVVLPNGDVFDFFTEILSSGAVNIAFVRSTDKGATFDATPTVVTDIELPSSGAEVATPDSQEAVRDASGMFSVAVDPASGALYLAWQECSVSKSKCSNSVPISSIAFSQSTDNGKTWSAPTRINQTPQILANPLRSQAFIPAIVPAGSGTLAVTYYDFRNDVDTPGLELADYFAAFCTPSASKPCSDPANWGNELRLTPKSFNMLDAPVAGGHFLGDYMGLAAAGTSVYPVFGQAVGKNLTADFTTRITVP